MQGCSALTILAKVATRSPCLSPTGHIFFLSLSDVVFSHFLFPVGCGLHRIGKTSAVFTAHHSDHVVPPCSDGVWSPGGPQGQAGQMTFSNADKPESDHVTSPAQPVLSHSGAVQSIPPGLLLCPGPSPTPWLVG